MPDPTKTSTKDPCPYCDRNHHEVCPKVSALEYHPDGTLKRVEFHGPVPLARSTIPDGIHPAPGGITYVDHHGVPIASELDPRVSVSGGATAEGKAFGPGPPFQ